jgi:hypothetical protein
LGIGLRRESESAAVDGEDAAANVCHGRDSCPCVVVVDNRRRAVRLYRRFVRRLQRLLAPGGALLLASLFAGRSLAATHYDLLFRATAGCAPLPHREQLDVQLREAGFTTTRWMQLIPFGSFLAVVAER